MVATSTSSPSHSASIPESRERSRSMPQGSASLWGAWNCRSASTPSIRERNSPPTAISFPKSCDDAALGTSFDQAHRQQPTAVARPPLVYRQPGLLPRGSMGVVGPDLGQQSGRNQRPGLQRRLRPMDNPTWADVQPVLNQYAVLYPGMTRRLDLSNYQAVSSNSAEILEVISLPIAGPRPHARDPRPLGLPSDADPDLDQERLPTRRERCLRNRGPRSLCSLGRAAWADGVRAWPGCS